MEMSLEVNYQNLHTSKGKEPDEEHLLSPHCWTASKSNLFNILSDARPFSDTCSNSVRLRKPPADDMPRQFEKDIDSSSATSA